MAGILSADPRLAILKGSLDGLSHRQQLIANNVANLDTPGYRALDVPFEQLLVRQMSQGGDVPMMLTSDGHMNAVGTAPGQVNGERSQVVFTSDGNGVDVDSEMERLAETAIQFSAVTQLLSARLAILKSAVTEGRR